MTRDLLPLDRGALFHSPRGARYELGTVLRRDDLHIGTAAGWITCPLATVLARVEREGVTPSLAVLTVAPPVAGVSLGAFVRTDALPDASEVGWFDAGPGVRGGGPLLDAGVLTSLDPPAPAFGASPYRGDPRAPRSAPALRFIARPYTRGVSLEALLAAARRAGAPPFPPRIARGVAVQLAHALAALHTTPRPPRVEALWHGALAPRHVVLDTDGVVRLLTPVVRVEPPELGTRWRTSQRPRISELIRHLAPEEVRGVPTTASMDVYRLGALLWRVFTGRAAFVRDSDFALLEAIMRAPRPALSESAPEVPAELDALVARLLAIEPSRRPPDALAAAVELAEVCGPAGVASADEIAAHLGTLVHDDEEDEERGAGYVAPDARRAEARWRALGSDDAPDVIWVRCDEPIT